MAGRSSAGKNAALLVLGPELRSRPCWETDVSLKDEDQRVILGSAINLVGLIDPLTGDQFLNELSHYCMAGGDSGHKGTFLC